MLACILVLSGACSEAHPASRQQRATLSIKRKSTFLEVPANSPLRTRITVQAVVAKPIRRSLEAPAQVEADPARLARITPPLAGRIQHIFVRVGDTTKATSLC